MRLFLNCIVIVALITFSFGQHYQTVTILLDSNQFVKGELISQDDGTITLSTQTGAEVIINKYEILNISAGKQDVTANYLSASQLEKVRELLAISRKKRIKSIIAVGMVFMVFFAVSQVALTTGGGGSDTPGEGDTSPTE
ncbi:MAG: hypothetical protein ACETWG_06215 [Candidatus Neomarinimicrobiota bacterium]